MIGALWFFLIAIWLVFGFPFGLAALAYGQFEIAAYVLLPGFVLVAATMNGLLRLLI